MPLSKAKKRAYMRARRSEKKRLAALHTHVLSRAEVRALRAAGLDPSAYGILREAYNVLRLDRDAIKAHLSWHHESTLAPDIGTIVERLQVQLTAALARITALEADHTLHDALTLYHA